MSVYDVTYKTLGNTHLVISTAEYMGEYSLPDKRNLSLRYYSGNIIGDS